MGNAAIIAVLILLVAACGGGDGDEEASSGDQNTPATSDAPDQGASGEGAFSVLMVAGVDTVTADGQLAELEGGGFEGFIKEGSADTGFDVYRSGLTEQEAQDLLDEIRAALFPESAGSSIQPGFVWETGSWRSDDTVAGDDDAGAASSASVTVGQTEYVFSIDLPLQCSDNGSVLFGTFAVDASGNALEGGDANRAVALNFSVPVTDWESRGLQPPQIAVDDATTGQRWQAGGMDGTAIEPGDSEVISWELGDGRAEGTATFTDINAHFAGQETEPMPGAFEIVCAN